MNKLEFQRKWFLGCHVFARVLRKYPFCLFWLVTSHAWLTSKYVWIFNTCSTRNVKDPHRVSSLFATDLETLRETLLAGYEIHFNPITITDCVTFFFFFAKSLRQLLKLHPHLQWHQCLKTLLANVLWWGQSLFSEHYNPSKQGIYP